MSAATNTKGDRLQHKRYKDGREKSVTYTGPQPRDYKVWDNESDQAVRLKAINTQQLRGALKDKPIKLRVLDERLRSLESLFSMDFDASALHAAPLYVRRVKNGSRYLNEVLPCYCYVTLQEHHDATRRRGGFRAANGEISTLALPIYLTLDHGTSFRKWLCNQFSRIANINTTGSTSKWHDLWVPDIVAHLINQAIVDFSRYQVSETGIQFVLDAQRFLIYCCEAPKGSVRGGGELMFPNMLPLMRKFLLNFIHHPQERTRDRVPDLGDMLQWLAVVELLDPSLSWKEDLVHAVIVESMRRMARWVANHIIEERDLTPQTIRRRTGDFEMVPDRFKAGKMFKKYKYEYHRETRAQMVLRFVKESLSREQLLGLWWEQAQVGCRVILYSHTFYSYLFEGKTLNEFKAKYDCVLGGAYPKDIRSIQSARREIEAVDNLSLYFKLLGYPISDNDLYRLCLWAVEAQEGYERAGRSDPLEFGWKELIGRRSISGRRKKGSARAEVSAEKTGTKPGQRVGSGNPFDLLGGSDDESDSKRERPTITRHDRPFQPDSLEERLRNRRGVVVSIPGS